MTNNSLNQAKTPDFTRGRLYERVKLFSIERNIGGFHKDFYIQQIEKLAYHRSYHKILGKHHVDDVRHKAFESILDDISTWSYYSEWYSFEPDSQLQNELFDNNRTLSMECFCLDILRKTVNVSNFYENGGRYFHQSNDTVRGFCLHLSDSKMQNAANTTAHINTLLAGIF